MFTAEVECRYNRQNYELPISVRLPFTEDAMNEMTEKFHMEHERSYGYLNRSMDIQMVGYRLSAVGLVEKPELEREEEAKHPELPAPAMIRPVLFEGSMDYTDTPVYYREQLVPGIIFNGPAILEQMDSTSVIPPGWTARVDGFRNILAVQEGGRHEK